MSVSFTVTGSIFGDLIAELLGAINDVVLKADEDLAHEVRSLVLRDAVSIELENTGRILDAPSERWVRFCSVLLAIYHALVALTGGRTEALALMTEATRRPFVRNIGAYLSERFGISQDAPEAAFDRIAENFKARGEARFGATFTYVQEVQGADRSHIKITQCFFADFFTANGAPEVTPVLCALDMVWAEELAHPRYGVRFARPATLAAGDGACWFQFSRVFDPQAA